MTSPESSVISNYRQEAINLLSGQLGTVRRDTQTDPRLSYAGSRRWITYFNNLRDKHALSMGRQIISAMAPRIAQLSTAPVTAPDDRISHAVDYGVTFATEVLSIAAKAKQYDWQGVYEFWAEDTAESGPVYLADLSAADRYAVERDYLRSKCERGLAVAVSYDSFLSNAHVETSAMKSITGSPHEQEVFDLALGLTFDTAITTLGQLSKREVEIERTVATWTQENYR